MGPHRVGTEDVSWLVARLGERRAALVPHGPVLWRPAADAGERHREFLDHLIRSGEAVGYRSDTDVILAQRTRHGWLVDDAAVREDAWTSDGWTIWAALVGALPEPPRRFVCPVHEVERRRFAQSRGYALVTSWWHRDVAVAHRRTTSRPEREPSVPGAAARRVPAPPVYDPGGPVLFLAEVHDASAALAAAVTEGAALGAPVVVVDQPATDTPLGEALEAAGFVRHCDFLERSG
jgi:hypothetical protein